MYSPWKLKHPSTALLICALFIPGKFFRVPVGIFRLRKNTLFRHWTTVPIMKSLYNLLHFIGPASLFFEYHQHFQSSLGIDNLPFFPLEVQQHSSSSFQSSFWIDNRSSFLLEGRQHSFSHWGGYIKYNHQLTLSEVNYKWLKPDKYLLIVFCCCILMKFWSLFEQNFFVIDFFWFY